MSNNKLYDKRLNIFYADGLRKKTENESNEILENNLSRVLAIFLREKEFKNFQKRFLEKFNFFDKKINDVSIQNPISVLVKYYKDKDIRRIIPVTITTSKNAFDENYVETKDAIPDIVIEIDNTLMVIEVKKINVRAVNQVLYQAKQLSEGLDIPYKDVRELTWQEDIIPIFASYTNNLLVKHYIEYINIYYPQWFDFQIREYKNKPKLDYKMDRYDPINIIFIRAFENLYSKENIDNSNFGISAIITNGKELAETKVVMRYHQDTNEIGVHMYTGETQKFAKLYCDIRKNNKKQFDIEGFNKNKFNYITPYIGIKNTIQHPAPIINSKNLPLKNIEIMDQAIKVIKDIKADNYEKIKQIYLYNTEIDREILFEINKLIEETNEVKNIKKPNVIITMGFDIYRKYPIPTHNKTLESYIKETVDIFSKFFGLKINK